MFDEPIISACNLSGNIVASCAVGSEMNGTVFTSQLAVRAEMVGGGGGGFESEYWEDDTETTIKPTNDKKVDASHIDGLADVATSGSYNDLSDTPTPCDKRTEWVSLVLMYQGFAPQGSAESDAVWTIYKIVTLATGGVVSNTEYTNKKWTEREIL